MRNGSNVEGPGIRTSHAATITKLNRTTRPYYFLGPQGHVGETLLSTCQFLSPNPELQHKVGAMRPTSHHQARRTPSMSNHNANIIPSSRLARRAPGRRSEQCATASSGSVRGIDRLSSGSIIAGFTSAGIRKSQGATQDCHSLRQTRQELKAGTLLKAELPAAAQ